MLRKDGLYRVQVSNVARIFKHFLNIFIKGFDMKKATVNAATINNTQAQVKSYWKTNEVKTLYRADDFVNGKGIYRGIYDNIYDAIESLDFGVELVESEPESGYWSEINLFEVEDLEGTFENYTESELMELWQNGNVVKTLYYI